MHVCNISLFSVCSVSNGVSILQAMLKNNTFAIHVLEFTDTLKRIIEERAESCGFSAPLNRVPEHEYLKNINTLPQVCKLR